MDCTVFSFPGKHANYVDLHVEYRPYLALPGLSNNAFRFSTFSLSFPFLCKYIFPNTHPPK